MADMYGNQGQFSASDLSNFIAANINNPQAIVNAANQFNISAQDIQKAAGFTPEQQTAYLAGSNIAPTAISGLSSVSPTTTPATTTPVTTTATTPGVTTGTSVSVPTSTVTAPSGAATSPGGSFTQGGALPNITTTQTQSTAAPSWYMDYLSNLAQKSGAAAQGAKFVGATPLQQKAFEMTGQVAGQYQPLVGEAAELTRGAADRSALEAAQPYMTAAGRGTYEDIGKYMSPYVEDVVKQIGALGQRQIQQNIAPGVTSGLVGAGQFGSKRGAEALGQALRDAQQNILAQQSTALQSGYGQALQAAQADLARQANLAGTAGTLAGSDIGRQLSAGQQLGALGTTGQALNLADINSLATLGAQQQAIEQNRELFPLQAMANQAALLRGYSIPTSVSTQYTGPIPGAYAASPLQQIAGLMALFGGLSNTQFGKGAGNLVTKALEKVFGGSSGSTSTGGINVDGSGVTNPFDADWWGGFEVKDGGHIKKYAGGGDVRGYATAGSVVPPIPQGLGADSKAREEYFGELNKILEAIQERSEPSMDYLSVASALLDPGRTGNIGEALGRTAGMLAARQEKQRERELPLAQARASIAGQKYQIENEAKALELVATAMGTTPEVAGQQLNQGVIPSDMVSKLTPGLFVTVNKLDPKLGSALKGAFDMDVERRKLAQEDVKAGMNYAEGVAKYGADFVRLLPRGIRVPGMPEAGQVSASPSAPAPAAPTSSAPAKAPVEGDLEGMPLAARADVLRQRAQARDEEFKPMRGEILQWTPQVVSRANDRLDELMEIARDPKGAEVFGLLQKQGILPAMAAAAEQAVRVGQTSVSFPVQQFVEKIALTPEQQKILRRASQLLTEEFFESAKSTKSVLGPQMSNADTVIQQRPMATIEDAASTVDYWAKQRKLLNYQRRDLFNAITNWDKRVGVQAPAGQFFTSREYNDVVNRYDSLQRQFREKYPGFGAR